MAVVAIENDPSCAGCPTKVGVAPGTTTILTGPTTGGAQVTVGCGSPARQARQRYLLYPPGKFVGRLPPMPAPTVVSPYSSIESLRGAGLGRLGIVLAPAGNNSPNPSYGLVAATKTRAYCTRRPERGPDYRWWQTAGYESQARNRGLNGLGAVPTDLQLSTQYGYTPVMSQWIPFKEGTWAPAPWTPPRGTTSSMPQDQPYWSAPLTAGPTPSSSPVDRQNWFLGDAATPAATVSPGPVDLSTAALIELKNHQDKMFKLSVLSVLAVASTAIINVFRYHDEKRIRRRHTRVDAEPSPVMSGAKRRKRRR